jgi:1,4-alpha-glucan branching enzyme
MARAKAKPTQAQAQTPTKAEPEGDTVTGQTDAGPFRVTSPWASTVMLVGEFNEWSTTSTPMQRIDGTDDFVAQVELEPGRRYRYKFLVDGERWENDPSADDYVANEYGGHDSVRQC